MGHAEKRSETLGTNSQLTYPLWREEEVNIILIWEISRDVIFITVISEDKYKENKRNTILHF